MRKLVACFTLISMLFLLSSCASLGEQSGMQKQEALESTSSKVNYQDELIMLEFQSLDAYNEYFSSLDSEPKIVYYDDISQFGDFKSFVGPSMADLRIKNSYDGYRYILCDKSGYVYLLTIEHTPPVHTEFKTAPIESSKNGDLRHCEAKELASFELDGYTYGYVAGELFYISWFENGVSFLIGGQSMADYPNTTDTFVGKLLNSATAPDAIKTIKAMNITEGLPRGTADANITPVS